MTSPKNTDFTTYQQLLARVDEKFAAVSSKYSEQFQCREGCFGCCKAGLTVTKVESSYIREWLARNPAVQEILKDKAAEGRHGDVERCEFLTGDGICSIYEARPIVCRSHGAPILMPSENQADALEADVCPLNFETLDLATLAASDWLRIDTLNLILTAVNREFDPHTTDLRIPLKILDVVS